MVDKKDIIEDDAAELEDINLEKGSGKVNIPVPEVIGIVEEEVVAPVAEGKHRRGRSGGRQQRDRVGRAGSEKKESDLFEKVIFINRCAKVVKGGRRFSFSALVVAGDRKGKVGIGFGKANEVSESIRKATDGARKELQSVELYNTTIPHEVFGSFGGGRVLLRPASAGTGLIAGGGVRAVLEAAGVHDVLAKSLGSNNPVNVVKATLTALQQLRKRETIFKLRGKTVRKAE